MPDASTHSWVPGDAGKYDLVVTMEDATSAIYSMFLVDEEGTASSMRGVAEVVARHGLFCSLYTDRGSHYCFTPEAAGPVSRTVLTQFGRALKQLGIDHIAAYSPQARGRSERAFSTLQDRLPKELKLAGISTVEAANRWLSETYMAQHNKQFAIAAEQEGSAFVADTLAAWREILCVQEERTVGNDNTVKWQRLSLQLPPSRLRPHFVRADVRVHEYPDGALAVYWGPHRLNARRAIACGLAWPRIRRRARSYRIGCRAPGRCCGAGTTRWRGWSRFRRNMPVGSTHCLKRPMTMQLAKPCRRWSIWTLRTSSPSSHRVASDVTRQR